MPRTSLCTLLFVFLVLNAARAQDPIKSEPTHYKLAFENESVQVVNIHYGPHEKSAMHAHPGGVVVVLTAGHLKFTDDHGQVREVRALAGESRWFPPYKHIVENLGNTPYNAVYIAIKNHTAASGKSSLPVMDAHTMEAHTMDARTKELLALALAAKP